MKKEKTSKIVYCTRDRECFSLGLIYTLNVDASAWCVFVCGVYARVVFCDMFNQFSRLSSDYARCTAALHEFHYLILSFASVAADVEVLCFVSFSVRPFPMDYISFFLSLTLCVCLLASAVGTIWSARIEFSLHINSYITHHLP